MSGDNAYKERMRRKKAVVDAHVAQADTDKGLLLVLTGNGKGKSSSGFGMVARALGHGMKWGWCSSSRVPPRRGRKISSAVFPTRWFTT